MKILYVITGADIGGAQRHLLYMANWFSKHGAEVHVVVGEKGPLIQELTEHGISVTVLPIARTIKVKQDLMVLRQLYQFIKKGRFDIVHSHSSKAGILGRIAGFLNRVDKNIFTAHGFVFTDPTLSNKKRLFYVMLERICSYLSTDIITVSKFDYVHGQDNRIHERKMTVIHNGIPEEGILSFSELEKKQHDLRQMDKRIIGFVGRFAAEKNLDMLLRVASHFKNQPDVEFWVIGDGPSFDEYQRKAQQQNLPLHFLGNQDNVLEWMDQMHVLVITSHKEGLPYVLLEACSRGLPVVSTDVGGIKEVIGDDVLVPINDDQRMIQCLTDLLANDDHREQLGKFFLETANRFTVEKMCVETKQVYFRGRNEHVIYNHNQSY